MDKDGELTVPGQAANTDSAILDLVGVVCNYSLLCPPYESNRPTLCVVCSMYYIELRKIHAILHSCQGSI